MMKIYKAILILMILMAKNVFCQNPTSELNIELHDGSPINLYVEDIRYVEDTSFYYLRDSSKTYTLNFYVLRSYVYVYENTILLQRSGMFSEPLRIIVTKNIKNTAQNMDMVVVIDKIFGYKNHFRIDYKPRVKLVLSQ